MKWTKWKSQVKSIMKSITDAVFFFFPNLSIQSLETALKYCNYFFTSTFVIEATLKLMAFGFRRFFKDRYTPSYSNTAPPIGLQSKRQLLFV